MERLVSESLQSFLNEGMEPTKDQIIAYLKKYPKHPIDFNIKEFKRVKGSQFGKPISVGDEVINLDGEDMGKIIGFTPVSQDNAFAYLTSRVNTDRGPYNSGHLKKK